MSARGPGARRSGGPCPDGLLCAIALDPDCLPRNRFFWVYEEPRARRAHGRAYALRRLREQLIGLFDSVAPALSIGEEEHGVRIAYRDDSLALIRRIHLSQIETSLLRLLLARDREDVPALLQASPLDRLRVAAALERIRTYPGLPDPSGWSDVLAPLRPAAAPSNTTE